MSVSFRNVDVDPDSEVEGWPPEAVQTALERGGLDELRRVAAAIRRDPWGPFVDVVGEVLTYSRPYGIGEILDDVIAHARSEAQQRERAEVAAEVDALIVASGLPAKVFARRMATSASRLATYRSGRVVPSAALMVRMRDVAGRHRSGCGGAGQRAR